MTNGCKTEYDINLTINLATGLWPNPNIHCAHPVIKRHLNVPAEIVQ